MPLTPPTFAAPRALHAASQGRGTELLGQAVALLGRFICIREANIRYLGLETMAKLAQQPE